MLENTQQYRSLLPDELFRQIEEVCQCFKEIQNEAAGILQQSSVADTSAHLNDVLASTEQATTSILDLASEISNVAAANLPPGDALDQINGMVTRMYEACNFQDISGQRIKKVLRHLTELETRLTKLNLSARAHGEPAPAPRVESPPSLTNGPQLAQDAPDQSQIDNLFASLE